MNTNIKQNIKVIILGLLLAGGVSFVLAEGTWTAPTCSPPNCNVDAPINVGTSAQIKVGKLALGPSWTSAIVSATDYILQLSGNLLVNGQATFNGPIVIKDGSQANGRFLKSNENGLATWSDISGGGNVKVNTVKFNRLQSKWIQVEGYSYQSIASLSKNYGGMFSDNPITLNALCRHMFQTETPYILSYQRMEWDSPGGNTTFYWHPTENKFKALGSTSPDPLDGSVTLNHGVHPEALFSCTSVQTQYTN